MNKNKVLEIINSFVVSKNILSDEKIEITNVTTNLQNTKNNDVVFYKINVGNQKSEEDFVKRKKNSTYGLLILNSEATFVKDNNTVFISSQDFLKVQKMLLDSLFPNKNKLKIVGVTGTNGKTTTVNLAMQMADAIAHKSFSIGTIGVQDINGEIDSLDATTPSYVELRKLIHKYQDTYEICFMEVSSHALHQDRLFDLKLDAAAFTSFSQDHLDYHKTMEEYLKAKLLIDTKYLVPEKFLIIPAKEIKLKEQILSVAPNTKLKIAKTFNERRISKYPLFYKSDYNQSNAECALQLIEDLFGSEEIKKIELEKITTPSGRFSILEIENNKLAIVDYAHTPDALLNIGEAIKKSFPEYSLTVVFGCGGNRDKSKRPLMGKAVASFANKIIITSDNPRDEQPEDIIVDIIAGIESGYEAIVDRKKAIEIAITEMKSYEIVLIAGKGHEEYQEIKGVKYPFSDFNIVKEIISGKK